MKKWILIFIFISMIILCSPVKAAVETDGTGDYVGSLLDPIISSSFSFSIWFKSDIASCAFKHLFSYHPGFYISCEDLATDRLRAVYDGSGTDRTLTIMTPVTTVWNHVCVAYDGAAMTAYLNGVQVDTNTATGNVLTTGELGIGTYMGDPTSPTWGWDGQFEDAAIWDVALTSAECGILGTSKGKRMPLQIKPANLIKYYPLDDQPDGESASGDIFLDLGSTKDNGAGVNGVNRATTTLTYP